MLLTSSSSDFIFSSILQSVSGFSCLISIDDVVQGLSSWLPKVKLEKNILISIITLLINW